MTDAIDIKTYDDEKFFGQAFPSLETVELVKGAQPAFEAGKVTVVYFFNTFYKGGYPIAEELTVMGAKQTGANFISISCDADKAMVEKYLTKIADGRVVDENTKEVQRMDVASIGYDAGKVVNKALCDVLDVAVLHTPHAFIIGGDGKIVWRQSLSQSFMLSQSNFEAQLEKALKGEAVVKSNGDKPKPVVDEGEAAEVDGDLALF